MAASKLVAEVAEDYLSCPICHEPYKQPKLLPCVHSYCRQCLERHIQKSAKNNVFNCAVCQRNLHVSEKGVDTFQDNFFLASLTEKLSPSFTKQICQVCLLDEIEKNGTYK